ncbi:CDP-alcohol phosphatidyltransferase family protein [Rosettibacter firmus]|uniref:CDP-alcohol phosphatidyltransferase family protein n=1 Tax=Rosettibacter firmus TaxID=3111522 RepID=UPI00336C0C40
MNLFPKYFFDNVLNLPNLISTFRLLLSIPLFISFQYLDTTPNIRYAILLLILIAFFSDFLDGYIARKKNLVTEFGKIIDPLADKIFIFILVFQLFMKGEIVSIYFWIIFLRDVIIFIGGIFVSKKLGKVLPSNLLGKITVLSIGIFLFMTVLGVSKIFWLYKIFFYLSITLSILSVIGYSLRAYEAIKRVAK